MDDRLEGWSYGLYAILVAAAAAFVVPLLFALRSRRSGATACTTDETCLEKFPGGPLTVYFGSQTGTAECYAQIVVAEGIAHGFKAEVVDLEEFDADVMLKSGKAIFLMATYGRGNPTDNAQKFFHWAGNHEGLLPDDYLSSLSYSVFGLGNTQYEHYNLAGRTTDKMLEALGANRVHVYGEGDDDADIEETFEDWKASLWEVLVKKFGGTVNVDGVEKAAATSIPFSLRFLSAEEAVATPPTCESQAACSTQFHWHAVNASVVVNRELRVAGVGSTRHIEIDLAASGETYRTADNLAVLPLNDRVLADRLCVHLGYDPDSVFTLDHDDSHRPVFPTPCTVRNAFLRFMDIASVPRRTVLEQLVPYVVDPTESELMHKLSSHDGREEYRHLVCERGETLAELLLESFSSISIPLEHFLCIVPHLHPRYYTISSSSSISPTRAHITVAVLQQEKQQGYIYNGICSTFLSKLKPPSDMDGTDEPCTTYSTSNTVANRCRVFVRESTFRLPTDSAVPILMIGPGTGVAPMRALLQERKWQKTQGLKVGPTWLYFGCRRRDEDYIYQDELEAYEADGTMDRLRLAFSREGTSKVYVQHLLRQDAQEVWELLGTGAHVYVCGGTHMGTEVHDELTRIAQEGGAMSAEQARKYTHDLQDSGRYVEELWS